jgi:hypothetical protein
MNVVRRGFASTSTAMGVIVAAHALGCSSHAKRATAPTDEHAREHHAAFEAEAPSATAAERHAQHVWCAYLESLYRRAVHDGAAWEELDRCNAERSTASPEMLERTAACSQAALDGFTGDPFTDTYAAEVKHCGTTALQALALPEAQVEPFVASACQRASACGQGDVASCEADLTSRFGERLCMALGALNPRSRIAVRKCVQTAACQAAEDVLSTCLDPMLDKLLWTPG